MEVEVRLIILMILYVVITAQEDTSKGKNAAYTTVSTVHMMIKIIMFILFSSLYIHVVML